jgi:hypothetical protein
MGSVSATGAGWLQAADQTNLASSYNLLLNPNGGNVGIGTSSPGARLDVEGAAASSNLAIKINNTDTSGYSTLQMGGTDAGIYRNGSTQGSYGGNSSLNIITVGAHPISFSTNNTPRATINSSGNVGIGTSSPTQKLSVVGASSSDTNPGIFAIGTDATMGSGTNMLTMGVLDDNYVFIQGTKPGYDTRNLVLQKDGGNVLVGGATSGSNHIIGRSGTYSNTVLTIGTSGDSYGGAAFFGVNNTAYTSSNAAAAPIKVGDSTTGRSINAAGTINAAGADYAEYMTKASEFELAKGDICGINADGKLTNVFADAVAFVVKSTNPSYVGGDTWGTKETIGGRPEQPIQQAAEVDEEGNETQAAETNEDFAARQAQYETDLAEFEAKLETERQKVDRIAFSGQVPVNVTNATAGQYIIPVNDNGAIKGQAVSNPTFEQYQSSVGKVIAVKDGKPTIIVKVV